MAVTETVSHLAIPSSFFFFLIMFHFLKAFMVCHYLTEAKILTNAHVNCKVKIQDVSTYRYLSRDFPLIRK